MKLGGSATVIYGLTPQDCRERGGIPAPTGGESQWGGVKEYSCTFLPAAPVQQSQPAANITVSPNIQTQVSPQVSPVFQQQYQPSNSPATAGTQQSSGNSSTPSGGGVSMADVQAALAAQAKATAEAQATRDAQVQAAQNAMLEAFTKNFQSQNQPAQVSPMAYVSTPVQTQLPATISAPPTLTEAIQSAISAPDSNQVAVSTPATVNKFLPWLIAGGILLIVMARKRKGA